jgi:hypothetical protein
VLSKPNLFPQILITSAPLFVVCCCVVCFPLAFLFRVGDQIQFFLKSLEFPAIEARYNPIGEMLVSLTQDTLIKETREIGHFTTQTHRDEYTGAVGGSIDRIFGTNRSIDDVVNDYIKFFSSKKEWTKWTVNYAKAMYVNHTEFGITCVSVKLADHVQEAIGLPYKVIYEVHIHHYEPGSMCGFG